MRKEVIGNCELYLGDCRDVLPTLGRVSIAITSPPYNMGLIPGGNGRGMYKPGAGNKGGRFRDGYGAHSDALPQDEYDAWQRECLALMWDRVDLGVFYNHRPRVEHGRIRTPLSFDYGGMPLRQIIIWDRGTGIDVNVRHFCTRQEWILLFAKPEFNLRDHASSGRGDVWRIGPETDKQGHPAPFPVGLPATIIESVAGDSALDPFMGTGTTGVACVRRGWRFVGVEIDQRWFDVACKRIEAAVKQPDMFIAEPAPRAEQLGFAETPV